MKIFVNNSFVVLAVAAITLTPVKAENQIKDDFIWAICLTESGGREGLILGDKSSKTGVYRALGPLQIHRSCWTDAIRHDPKIGGSYNFCTNFSYSKKIFISYQNLYKKKTNLEEEKMAKIWNGGVNFQKTSKSPAKTANLEKYWKKVQKNLAKIRANQKPKN